MNFLFVSLLVLLILSLPLGGFEILTGGRFALWSAWCRPTLVAIARKLVNKLPKWLRMTLFFVWVVVVFVIATPVVFVINYVVIWFNLLVETWGRVERPEEPLVLKPSEDYRADITNKYGTGTLATPTYPLNPIPYISGAVRKGSAVWTGKRPSATPTDYDNVDLHSDDEDSASTVSGKTVFSDPTPITETEA